MRYCGKIFDAKISKAQSIEFDVIEQTLCFSDNRPSIPLQNITLLSSEYAATLIFDLGGNEQLHTQNKELLESISVSQQGLNRLGFWVENHKASIFTSSVLSVLLVVVIFLYGIPNASKIMIQLLPNQVESYLQEQTMIFLESAFLEPTQISKEQQTTIKTKVNELCKQEPCPQFELYFYNAPSIGANAFASIGKNIIITDEMVKIATLDEMASVVAHELGHIEYKHSYELFLNSIGLSTFFAVWLGDVSSFSDFLINLPMILMQNGYSRDMEEKADEYALNLLRASMISPQAFKTILQKLDQRGANDSNETFLDTFFSTHPSTHSRLQKISN